MDQEIPREVRLTEKPQFGKTYVISRPYDNPKEREKFGGSELLGADVVRTDPSLVAIVDGVGSGRTGDRTGAINFLSRIQERQNVLPRGACIALIVDEQTNQVCVRGQGGTLAITWSLHDASPQLLYFGVDGLNRDETQSTTPLSAISNQLILLASDGGIELLSLLHEHNSDIEEKLRKVSSFISTLTYEERVANIIEILQPITEIIRQTQNTAEALPLINEVVSKIQGWVADDATVVLTSLT